MQIKQNNFSHIKSGWETIGGKRMYFRSKLEKDCAKIFQTQKERGFIQDWSYEPTTFWFNEIKRGVRSYKPDFLIKIKEDSFWIECKGYMDAKSKTKIRRFKKYYPNRSLSVVTKTKDLANLILSLGNPSPKDSENA